jgi:hypothetical protein
VNANKTVGCAFRQRAGQLIRFLQPLVITDGSFPQALYSDQAFAKITKQS